MLLALGVLVHPGNLAGAARGPRLSGEPPFRARLGRGALGIAVGPETRYQLWAESIASHWQENTVAALIASPSNPTGTLITHEHLQGVYETVAGRDGTLLVDEIYHGLTYGVKERSALEIAEDIVVINSFSKYFTMTGWRIGWMVVPQAMVREIERLAQNMFISPPTLAQYAALAAFAPETMEVLSNAVLRFANGGTFVVPELRRLGFEIPVVPDGAFYVYANCSRFTQDSFEFCRRLLDECGVAITPGVDFGVHRGDRACALLVYDFARAVGGSDRAHRDRASLAATLQRTAHAPAGSRGPHRLRKAVSFEQAPCRRR